MNSIYSDHPRIWAEAGLPASLEMVRNGGWKSLLQ